ncbi:hypothetical protein NAC44_13270 [Allorhizobium sp. BGMRC 0089]|uniref:hypothetical protein n=1 Tax=Allorhizobium sonneratiae TaxID=2934936 RepID=UPI002033EFB1|nr:hypothetical protein [Allorhizobium sonneratiae]MCM2293294.1 hypothetical protein [Allorhizobium sonneratiae]
MPLPDLLASQIDSSMDMSIQSVRMIEKMQDTHDVPQPDDNVFIMCMERFCYKLPDNTDHVLIIAVNSVSPYKIRDYKTYPHQKKILSSPIIAA